MGAPNRLDVDGVSPRRSPLRVVGIDPGTRHLGWGIVDVRGARVTHVAHGVIDTSQRAELAERLVEISHGLRHVLDTYGPTAAAVESIFFSRDAQAAAKLGHARGVVLLVLAERRVDISEYAPKHAKRTLVGHGAADKTQMARMVAAVLGLDRPPRSDAADALALAVVRGRCDPLRHAAGRR